MTSFANRVEEAVGKIPRGKAVSYKEVAKLAGKSNDYRAVGNILNKNRDPKIPCHRVIRSDGKIGGYNKGTKEKTKRLSREGVL